MKKKMMLILGTAAMLTGCSFDPFGNRATGVYGPPETEQTSETSVSASESEESNNDVSLSVTVEEFDPAENEIADVYGPPEYFESETHDETDITTFDPEQNDAVCMYGPPPTNLTENEEKE